jgi:hypothetical protein
MRFTISSSIAKLLFAVVTVLGVASVPAMAQDASGKFTLAKEVRWGTAVLPAGEYTYSLEHPTGQVLFVRNTNRKMGAIMLVKSASLVNGSERDRIVLQRSGDDWFVSSLVVTSLGQELTFGAPTARTETAKNGTSPAKVAALTNP